ncbi:hypothetical protein ACGFYQ_33760 [Streptomyces sp. NPDC048258]|uniref:hypothetical protein n=1 Tax=Streptomyces sp. NPDC048258 TaxID=3365527 RepID=UPI00371BC59E
MSQFNLAGWDEPEEAEAAAQVLAAVDTTRDSNRQQAQESVIAERVDAALEAARPGLHKIPDPVLPAGDGDLTPEEQERFALCVDGIALHETAWFMLGKSLDTVAVGRLFRRTRHKLEPERYYNTIEEWALLEKGISVSRCSQLRAAWEIGEVLKARGYESNPGQVREIVPVKNAYGLNGAVAVYVLVADSVGADKVTAARLQETVKMMPGNLQLNEEDDPEVLAKTIEGVLVGKPSPRPVAAIPPAVRRAVDRRAVDLANVLDRSRIPRTEVERHLLEAFADEKDSTVFDAVLARMKQTPKP